MMSNRYRNRASRVAVGALVVLLASMGATVANEEGAKDAYSECSDKAAGAADIVPCLHKLQHEANNALVATLKDTTAQIKGIDSSASPAAIKSLDAAMKQFESFRNIECQRVGDAYLGGSGSGAAQAACAVDLTRWFTDRISFGS